MAQGVMVVVMLLFAASLSAIFFRRIKFPYTIGLVMVGIVLSFLCDSISLDTSSIHLTPDLILYILLPALIFDASVSMDVRMMMRNIVPSMVLAAPGLIISTFITGALIYWLTPLDIGGAMLFGALISATDPVAVIALFKELGAPKRLTMLVDAESLFNDATAIVMFNIVKTTFAGAALTFAVCVGGAKDFVVVFFAGLLVGAVIGLVMTFIIKRAGNEPLVQIALSTIVAYTAFIVADKVFNCSGVMSVVGAGFVISYYGRGHFTPEVREYLGQFWSFAAFVANSFIFLLLGFTEMLMIVRINDYGMVFANIGWAVLAIQVARAVVVFGLCPLVGRFRQMDRIDWKYQLVIFWGGLRGAVPMALVLSLPVEFPHRNLLICLTLGVVLFTLLVQGTSIRRLMDWLGLNRVDNFTLETRHLASMLAHRKGLERLEKLESMNKLPAEVIGGLKDDYRRMADADREAMEALKHEMEKDLSGLRKNLWIDAFSVCRTSINSMRDRGLLSPPTYNDLMALINSHSDMVLEDKKLDRDTFKSLNFKFERLILRLAGRLGLGMVRNRLLSGAVEHDLEKAMAIYVASKRTLEMLDEAEGIYGGKDGIFQECRDYFTGLNVLSSAGLDRIRDRNSPHVVAGVRAILMRVAYDAERAELLELRANGSVPDAVVDKLLEELNDKMDSTFRRTGKGVSTV